MGLLFVLFVIGVIVFVGYRSGQSAVEQWKIAAQRLNLAYQPGSLGGKGSIRGSLIG